jgi:hypothetical protein
MRGSSSLHFGYSLAQKKFWSREREMERGEGACIGERTNRCAKKKQLYIK